jgi:hypothetical protein
MSWVRDLSNEERTSAVGDVGAEAHDESTGEIHGISLGGVGLVGETLDQGSDNDKQGPNGSSLLSTQTIGDIGGKEKNKESSEAGKGSKKSESAAGGMPEN